MSIGLHCRLARPGRVSGVVDFLDYIKSHRKDVWVCTREQIADFWYENHYPRGGGSPMKERPADEDEGKEFVFSEGDGNASAATEGMTTDVEIVPTVEGGYTTLGGDVGQELS
jgi:hypothetical protein